MNGAVDDVWIDAQVARNLLDEHLVDEVGQIATIVRSRLQWPSVEHDAGPGGQARAVHSRRG